MTFFAISRKHTFGVTEKYPLYPSIYLQELKKLTRCNLTGQVELTKQLSNTLLEELIMCRMLVH